MYASSIKSVRITDADTGAEVVGSVSIPSEAREVIIVNNSTTMCYLALNELDLSNEYARMELSETETGPFRMKLPAGVGTIWVTAGASGVPNSFVSFWIV